MTPASRQPAPRPRPRSTSLRPRSTSRSGNDQAAQLSPAKGEAGDRNAPRAPGERNRPRGPRATRVAAELGRFSAAGATELGRFSAARAGGIRSRAERVVDRVRRMV
jgi:hypothetical protein